MILRPATIADLSAIAELIPDSARGLSRDVYTPAQVESLVRFVFGPDSQLIADGSYWVAEEDGRLVGCGGWSRRSTLFGGDQMKGAVDPLLDPSKDPARIRAFFVRPAFARMGVGKGILDRCIEEARKAGFRSVELMATLPGVPFYSRFGFIEVERVELALADGAVVGFVRMSRPIA